MNLGRLSLLLVLQLSIAKQLRSTVNSGASSSVQNKPPRVPYELAKDGYWGPPADTIPQGVKYLKPGSGCDDSKQPSWAKAEKASNISAVKFNVNGWSGFCQAGQTTCPDARANKDYMYYARAMGQINRTSLEKHRHERSYCALNGWLSHEYRSIINDFTALQKKGVEECQKKKIKWLLEYPKIFDPLLDRIGDKDSIKLVVFAHQANKVAVVQDRWINKKKQMTTDQKFIQNNAMRIAEMGASFMSPNVKLAKMGYTALQAAAKQRNISFTVKINHDIAYKLAAWSCAMGDVSCDIAYCNYAYCSKEDGTVGIAEYGECAWEWGPKDGAMSRDEKITTSTTSTTSSTSTTEGESWGQVFLNGLATSTTSTTTTEWNFD